VRSATEAAAPYGSSIIFLFMGGFILGLGMQRWGLHRRFALLVLRGVGTRPLRLVAGFMLATALLSMWISNTATVIMMLPIATSLLATFRAELTAPSERGAEDFEAFATVLMLGTAYAASIGGMGTLIGTPPNLVLASFVEQHYGVEVTMVGWLRIGLPLVVVFLPLAWLYLTRIAYPVRVSAPSGGAELVAHELRRLGPLSRGERLVLAVFALTAIGWMTRPQLVAWTGVEGITDTGIAVLGALLLFALPVDARERIFAMDWETAKRLPWEILILFGGGLSLAAAIAANGVDTWLASAFAHAQGAPALVVVAAVATLVVFLTEVTSNTAVSTTLMPVLAATAVALDMPAGLLLTTAALSASCAFMLPVATPPNAVVFASGHVRIGQMARAGIGLNLLAIVLVTALVGVCGCQLTLAGK